MADTVGKDKELWEKLETCNGLDARKRSAFLRKNGFAHISKNIIGILAKSHFVIPGKTRFECQQCGECCRYAKKVVTDPCSHLRCKNICADYEGRHTACRLFPFHLYRDKFFGDFLVIKPYCSGYGKGEILDYTAKLSELLKMGRKAVLGAGGNDFKHKIVYLPMRGEWALPSKENVYELMMGRMKAAPQPRRDDTGRDIRPLHCACDITGEVLETGRHAALVTLDEYGCITDANSAACTMFGRTRAQLRGTRFTMLFVDPSMIAESLLKHTLYGRVTSITQKVRRQGAAALPVLLKATSYVDRLHNVIDGALISIEEISPTKFSQLAHIRPAFEIFSNTIRVPA